MEFWRKRVRRIATNLLTPLVVLSISGTVPMACTTRDRTPIVSTTTVDSAGVTIVTHSAAVLNAAPTWTVDSPTTVVGGEDDREHYALFRVHAARFLDDGSIVVTNSGTQEVRIFGADGEYRRTIGKRGSGPGEFTTLWWAGEIDNGMLVAWDVQLARLTTFDRGGDVVGTLVVNPPEAFGPVLGLLVGVFTNGRLVLRDRPNERELRREPTGLRRDPSWYRWFNTDGEEIAVLEVPGWQGWFENKGRIWGTTPLIFGRSTQAAVARNHLVVGTNDSFELKLYRSSGDLTRVIRVQTDPVTASPDLVKGVREARMDSVRNLPRSGARVAGGVPIEVRLEPWRLQRIAEVPARETVPPFLHVVGDRGGRVWVSEYPLPHADSLRWIIFESNGAVAATALLPARWQLFDATAMRILVVSRDALDRESVMVVPLHEM